MNTSLKIFAAAAAVTLLSFSSAKADLEFTTAGGFGGPNATGGNLLFNDVTGTASTLVTFTGASNTTLPIPSTTTNVDFGTLNITTIGTPGVETFDTGNFFEIVFIPSNPFVSSATTDSTFLSGLVTTTAGGLLTLTFNSAASTVSFNSGSVVFTLNNEYDVPIDTNGNASFKITGTVTTTAAPEPSTYALMGAALLLGLPWLRRRRA